MKMNILYGLAIQLGLALLISLSVYFLLLRNLARLLEEVVRLPAGTAFYTRLLGIILVLIAISSALDKTINLTEDAVFMEYVLYFAGVLSSVFSRISWFLMSYLLLVTILVAALRRRSE